jgi:hypothetical protein
LAKWGQTEAVLQQLTQSTFFRTGQFAISSGFGGRISIWLLVFILYFYFFIGQQFRAGHYKISNLQQYLPVGGKYNKIRVTIN